MLLAAGLVVALLALLNVMALSNWHASLTDHDDVVADAVHLSGGHHHHHDLDDGATAGSADGSRETPAIDLHAMTHAMIHGLAGLVPNLDVAIPATITGTDWFAGRSFALFGIAPESLLRPPQA